ncbi:MAG: serine/threonine-protein kinase, partial [Candidatus Omnitrophota bacterium]
MDEIYRRQTLVPYLPAQYGYAELNENDLTVVVGGQYDATDLIDHSRPNITKENLIGKNYVVTQAIEGQSASEYLDQLSKQKASTVSTEDETASQNDMLEFLSALAEAIGVFHAEGIVHRDLGEGELFIQWDKGRIKRVQLIDFGLATTPSVGIDSVSRRMDGKYETVNISLEGQARDIDSLQRIAAQAAESMRRCDIKYSLLKLAPGRRNSIVFKTIHELKGYFENLRRSVGQNRMPIEERVDLIAVGAIKNYARAIKELDETVNVIAIGFDNALSIAAAQNAVNRRRQKLAWALASEGDFKNVAEAMSGARILLTRHVRADYLTGAGLTLEDELSAIEQEIRGLDSKLSAAGATNSGARLGMPTSENAQLLTLANAPSGFPRREVTDGSRMSRQLPDKKRTKISATKWIGRLAWAQLKNDEYDIIRTLLKNQNRRPEPSEIAGLSLKALEDILVEEYGYDVKNWKKTMAFQELQSLLPYLLEMSKHITQTFADHHVLVLGRDAELFYDALKSFDHAAGVTLFPMSSDYWYDNKWTNMPIEELRNYLSGFGINRDDFEQGKKFLILDTGFKGRGARTVRNMVLKALFGGLQSVDVRNSLSERLRVRLVGLHTERERVVTPDFLDYQFTPERIMDFTFDPNLLKKQFPRSFDILQYISPEKDNYYYLIAAAIQRLPKFHGHYKFDGKRVTAQQSYFSDVDRKGDPDLSIVNPPAALLTQKMAIDYVIEHTSHTARDANPVKATRLAAETPAESNLLAIHNAPGGFPRREVVGAGRLGAIERYLPLVDAQGTLNMALSPSRLATFEVSQGTGASKEIRIGSRVLRFTAEDVRKAAARLAAKRSQGLAQQMTSQERAANEAKDKLSAANHAAIEGLRVVAQNIVGR